jgi:hypothetical protein
MKHAKNTLWVSIVCYLFAFVIVVTLFDATQMSSNAYFTLFWLCPILLIVGIMSGWKNRKSQKSLAIIANLLNIVGVLALMLFIAYFSWAYGWTI